MLKYLPLLVLSILFLVSSNGLQAQEIPEQLRQQALKEIQKRGLSEEEVRQRLLARGLDVDNMSVEELQAAQPQIEAVIRELEAEKQAATNSNTTNITDTINPVQQQAIKKVTQELGEQKASDIKEKVAEGASVQEAISEELQETSMKRQDEPPSRIYGQELFRNNTLEVYRASKDIKPPDTYVLGVGDVVNISIFGASQDDLQLEIQADGFIRPSNMPRVYLKGITFGQAKTLLQQRFRQAYLFRPEEFALSINAARTMTINIFGEVETQGSFTISAVNTAFNALVAAGGPTQIGSIRNIRLLRGGKERYLDVYAFMNDPAVQFSYYLQDNDILFVPIAEKVITIQGAVNRPMRYELMEGEELLKLIDFAGGLTANAYTELVQVRRIQNNQVNLIDVPLSELYNQEGDFNLENGDVVIIRSIPSDVENNVTINGAVEFAGDYALINNMRVSDLLARGVLQEEARLDVAFLTRRNPDQTIELVQVNLSEVLASPTSDDNLTLKKYDQLLVFTQQQFVDLYEVTIEGAVRNPTSTTFEENLRVSDLITLAEGLETNAARYGYIKRVNPSNRTEIDYVKVDLLGAINNADQPIDQPLQPQDVLTIYTQERYAELFEVQVTGEVRQPGRYDHSANLRVSDLIYLAGGLTVQATDFAYILRRDPSRRNEVEYIRVDLAAIVADSASGNNPLLKPLDELRILNQNTYIDEATVRVSGAVRDPGEFAYNPTLTIEDLLTLAGGLELQAASNRIDVFRLSIDENQPTRTLMETISLDRNGLLAGDAGSNFELAPFDQVVVRAVPEFEFQRSVRIEGEVRYPGTYALLKDNERITDLIQRAGGLTPEAYLPGAVLNRSENEVGLVVLELDKAIQQPTSNENLVLKEGDVLTISKPQEIVSIRIQGTKANEVYGTELIENGRINIAYQGNKSAKWYIKNYASGFAKEAKRGTTSVEYPSGRIDGTRTGIFRNYPSVKPGSEIRVALKAPKVEREEREPTDWGKVAADVLASATTALTLILLVQQVN